MQVKTLHGQFNFRLQRYRQGKDNFTYFELTDQLGQGYTTPRLKEYSAYYSNRMSYVDVEQLLQRNQGKKVLSDQGIWGIVTEQAEVVSEQITQEVNEILAGHESGTLRVNSEVDIYDSHQEEILIFDDGIQVKGQRRNRHPRRRESTTKDLSSEECNKTPRVNTDVVMLQKSTGGFEYIIAPLANQEKTRPRLVDVIKAKVIQEYGERDSPLNMVAITDGARNIRLRLLSIFVNAIVIILDWYHLSKKIRELMSMIAYNKQEKSEHLRFLFSHLWRGKTEVTIDYLQHQVRSRNQEKLEELIKYLQKHQHEIIDYERRQKVGKTIGSGRMEKGVDQVVGYRQKKKGMSWCSVGSQALAILKVVELNGQWRQLWFPNAAV